MSGKKAFLLNGALMSGVGIILRTVTLVFGAYVSSRIGAESVGLNSVIMSVYSFALTLASSGVGLTVTRLVASHIGREAEDEIPRTMRGAIVYSLVFSVFATFLLFGLSGIISNAAINDRRAMPALNILALSLIPASLGGVFSGYFIAKRMVLLNAAVMLFGQAAKIGVTIILLGSGELTEASAVMSLALGITVSELLCFLAELIAFMILKGRTRAEKSGMDIRSVADMALPLATSAYIRSGLLSLEHSLIPKRLEARGDGIGEALSKLGTMQGMALPLILYPMTPLSAFSGLLLPEFAEAESGKDAERRSRIAVSAITSTLSYAILTAVVLFVFSEELGYGIYDSYSAGHFIAILAPVIPIMYLDHIVDSMLKGIGEQVYSMWVNIADSFLSVILVWLLIPLFGIEGYAAVIILMELFNFVLSYRRLKKRVGMRIDILDSLVLPVIAATVAALGASKLFVNGSSFIPWIFAVKILFVISVYIGAVMLLRSSVGVMRRVFKKK